MNNGGSAYKTILWAKNFLNMKLTKKHKIIALRSKFHPRLKGCFKILCHIKSCELEKKIMSTLTIDSLLASFFSKDK